MKTGLGLLAVVITIVSFLPYVRDIAAGRTRPHVISWFIWFAVDLLVFIAQVIRGGGPGSWATGATALFILLIFVLALFKGERTINRIDVACLAGTALAGLLWVITSDPVEAVVMITIIDVLGAIPTFRKSYTKPYEETLSTYVLWSLKTVFALFALDQVSVTTALYPACILLMNVLFVGFLLQRRNALGVGHNREEILN